MRDGVELQRILLVTRNLPPLVGGMERLNWHMAEELAKVAEVRVVGPAGSSALAPAGVIIREAPLKPLWKFLLRARTLARREAREWKPDIVLAGSGLTAPMARSAARKCGARSAVYVHGLDIAVKHPVYRALWLPAIRGMDRVIANSHATATLCREVGVDPERIGIVHPGVDLPENSIPLNPPSQAKGEADRTPFGTKGVAPEARGDVEPASPRGQEMGADSAAEPISLRERGRGEGTTPPGVTTQTFRQRHHLGNRPLLLSVGRLSARKGLREFVAQALPRIVAARPDAMLLIIGDAPKDALNAAAQSPDSIRAAAEQAGVANNLQFLGKVSDPELEAAYHAADVHVFPIREIPGDPEGFGMVAVEAAAHGLPTVAFAAGGVVDAVAAGQSGCLVASGDYAAFADAVLATHEKCATLRAGCIAFAEVFAWPAFGARVWQQLSRIAKQDADV